MKLGLPFGISASFWLTAGILRLIAEAIFNKPKKENIKEVKQKSRKVAVCLPSHNEEVVISKSIKALKRLVPLKQIYVVSDGSIDKTAKIARAAGCKVAELNPGRGKARALKYLIEHFNLLKRYEFIIFVDADCQLDKDYLKKALPVFINDPKVVAIAGYVVSPLRKHKKLTNERFYMAYRVRFNWVLQKLFTYGMSWKYANVALVIPGFASIYRTSTLRNLELDTPNILIEDFNLAFQIHKKRLGKIAHYPKIFAIDQDPDNFKDYWNQIKRWNVGLYQTIRHYGIWPSRFWMSFGLFFAENLISSAFIVSIPVLILLQTAQYYGAGINAHLVTVSLSVSSYVTLFEILSIFWILDYLMTLLVAVVIKKPRLAIYGLGFFFFSFVNALSLLAAIPEGFLGKSQGKWKPPTRR